MADIQLDNEAQPASGTSATSTLYCDSTSLEIVHNEGTAPATFKTIRTLTNANTADQSPAAATDTYLTNSGIKIPPALLRIGGQLMWRFVFTKSTTGTTGAIWTPRFGTAGTTADTALTTFTLAGQTAVADTGWAEGHAICRTAGASGVIELVFHVQHDLATTGFNTQQLQTFQFTSGAIALNTAALIFGWSINSGTGGAWTFQHVAAWGMSL